MTKHISYSEFQEAKAELLDNLTITIASSFTMNDSKELQFEVGSETYAVYRDNTLIMNTFSAENALNQYNDLEV